MNRDDVIRMAREVWGEQAILPFEQLERFAGMAVAHELVKIASKFESERVMVLEPFETFTANDIAQAHKSTLAHCVKVLRARAKEQTP